MIVVSDASQLITFARIGHFQALRTLYEKIVISTEVYREVVVTGKELPGAQQVDEADWIEVSALKTPLKLSKAVQETGLGRGEVSAVLLAKERSADLVLIDEWKGRRYATTEGLNIVGSVGLLEFLYRRGEVKDLRYAYLNLLSQKIRIEMRILQESLARFNFPPL